MKELWIEAEDKFIEDFADFHCRMPTKEEVDEAMNNHYFANYINRLANFYERNK